MNTRQKGVLILTAVILLGMLLFPPFEAQVQGTVYNLGYHYLAEPPDQGRIPASVNIPMLVMQWLGVALLGAIALLLLKGPQGGAAPAAGSHQPLPDPAEPPAVDQSRAFLGGQHHSWRRSIGAVPATLLVWIVTALITQSVQATSDAPGTENSEPSGQQRPATLAAEEIWENAYDAYKRGDYMTALRVYKPLAEQGDATAQHNLGLMYAQGQGVPQDYAEAVKWFRLAAEQGHAGAQYNLGVIYHQSNGVPQHYAEASKWFRLAAKQGHATAQHNLGIMYEHGQGVSQDDAEAVKWYRLAAEQGDAKAQHHIGVMYAQGHGVAQDYVEAVKWSRLAAKQGDAEAQYTLGVMYGLGRGVPRDDAEAVKWLLLAAKQGFASAQFNLGVMYEHGQGVSQDDAEAVKWYRLAAEQGDAKAQHHIGVMYAQGQGVSQDDVQAHKWFNLAAAGYPASEAESRNNAVKARDIVTARMTAAQLAEAQRLAREWRPKTGGD